MIRSAVIDGVATATEVSTVGVVYTALLGLLVYRQFDWRRIYPLLVETVALTGAVMLIIGTATGDGLGADPVGLLAVAGGGDGVGAGRQLRASWRSPSSPSSSWAACWKGIPAIVLFGPLLFPVAKAMGVHEVHYAMVVILAMGIGLFAPPFGVGFYGACAIGRISPDDALWRIWPYIFALVVALLIVAAIPWLSIGFL